MANDEWKKTREVVGRAPELFAAAQSWDALYSEINHIPSYPHGTSMLNQADVISAIDEVRRAHAAGQPYTLNDVPNVFGLHNAMGRLLEADPTPPRPKTESTSGLAERLGAAQGNPADWRRETLPKKS